VGRRTRARPLALARSLQKDHRIPPSRSPGRRPSGMAYLRPPLVVRRVLNPLAMRLGLAGTATLEVPGRRTGRPTRVPVIPVEHEGGRYLVSTRGEADWVRNLRASGRGAIRRRGREVAVRAAELPAAERAPVIAAYRHRVGRMVDAYFTRLPDPADHPVFRIEPEGR
jgi:deazaflavin-dependent oxidoreductase (nitroreductase family)